MSSMSKQHSPLSNALPNFSQIFWSLPNTIICIGPQIGLFFNDKLIAGPKSEIDMDISKEYNENGIFSIPIPIISP